MAAFTNRIVQLHVGGAAGSVCIYAGEQYRQPLDLLVGNNLVNLRGWTPSAHAEWRTAFWNPDDSLQDNGIRDAIEPSLPVEVLTQEIEILDQDANEGRFTLFIEDALLPDSLKNIALNAHELPTLIAYITFTAPGQKPMKAQARLAIGWRRGERSIIP